MSLRLLRIDRLVDADPKRRSIGELRRQLRSTTRDNRLVALARIRKQIHMTGVRDSDFALAVLLTVDPDSTCRWQATIIVGEFIEKEPGRVWQVARQLGKSSKADIRMASSTVLLEHLLEYHTTRMAPLFLAELALGDRRFAQAVASCSNFGNGRTKRRIQRIIDEAKKRSNEALPLTSRAQRTGKSTRRSRAARSRAPGR
jgi:hypothetical protein